MAEREKNISNDERQLWQSQNFLRRPEFIRRLIEKTNIGANDLVVEIGPGKGIITQQLAQQAQQVIGVEMDEGLSATLRSAFANSPNVNIVRANFLQWQLPKKPYKVFANIPFNMTTDIVSKLTEGKFPPEAAYLVMQDKAAERFTGKPIGTVDTQMSILLKAIFEMGITARIDRREFTPTPNVDAVLAMFKKRSSFLVEPQNYQLFRDFVIYGYNQWQPTILDSFKRVFNSRRRTLIAKEIGIEGARPSNLTLEQWLRLFQAFMIYVPQDHKELVRNAEQKLKSQQRNLKKRHRTR